MSDLPPLVSKDNKVGIRITNYPRTQETTSIYIVNQEASSSKAPRKRDSGATLAALGLRKKQDTVMADQVISPTSKHQSDPGGRTISFTQAASSSISPTSYPCSSTASSPCPQSPHLQYTAPSSIIHRVTLDVTPNGLEEIMDAYASCSRSKFLVKKADVGLKKMSSAEVAKQAAAQLKSVLAEVAEKEQKASKVDSTNFKSQISFALSVLEEVAADDNSKKGREEDDLSEVDASAVPEEVRDWLATTFTRKMGVRKDGDKPKFKSIVNALRAGMFVERMFRRMSGLQGLSYPTALIPHLKLIDEWSVDMFALNDAASGSSLKYVTYELLNRYDLVSKFKIPVSNLINFLDRIEAGYSTHSNPYHNLIHGADITQTCHYFMLQTGLMNWLTDLEIFAVLIAACCHDVEHTGTTNNFHINTQSSLALLYNDKSVLENHHVSYMFRTMHDFADCNILCNLSRDDFMEFRQLTVDMILATDMSFHFSQLKSMKAAILQPEPIEKTKALSLVLHTADIAHPAKEWNVHYRWTMLVIEEFFRQGDREFELGLPYSPLCDRHTLVIPDSQIGFINFIVAPSMEVCSDMLDKIVAPMEKLSRGTIEETPSPSVEGDAAGAKGESAKNASNGCPTFSIERPWDPHITSNRDTWKQKSVEEERKKQEKAADVAKSEDESSASKNGQSEVKSESPAKSDIKNGTNEEERKETSGGQTSQAPANSTKGQLSSD